jgi:hypothetical protein
MKRTNTESSIDKHRTLILLGALAALATSVACSNNSKPAMNSSNPLSAHVQPVALKTVAQTVSQPVPAGVVVKPLAPVKTSTPKLITYKSRDYGISFVYPWQYAYVSAKAIANGDASLQPKSDGGDSQFTLARIEIPKGFYPDTDFESGYFMLSLNQDLSEEQCNSAPGTANDVKVQTNTINGVDFRWIETELGGDGKAAKTRNYFAYTNGTCYELELGVKSRNEQGLAREVDPDQVLRRLDAILTTVKILPAVQNPAAQQVVGTVQTSTSDAKK